MYVLSYVLVLFLQHIVNWFVTHIPESVLLDPVVWPIYRCRQDTTAQMMIKNMIFTAVMRLRKFPTMISFSLDCVESLLKSNFLYVMIVTLKMKEINRKDGNSIFSVFGRSITSMGSPKNRAHGPLVKYGCFLIKIWRKKSHFIVIILNFSVAKRL